MIYEPCKIADSNRKQFSFRPDNFSQNGKIKLKPFITDYNRINNYLISQKEELEKYSHREKSKNNYSKTETLYNFDNFNNEEIIPNSEDNKYYYLQPVMKFAPRTEFERIYDTLNSYNYGSIDQNLIKDQLKTLGFLTVQNNKTINDQNEYSLLKEKFKVSPQTLSYLIKEKERLEKETKTPEIEDLLSNITDIIKINKEIIHDREVPKGPIIKKQQHKQLSIAKKKIINNYIAKNILSDYQKKTHFKALLSCSLNLNNNKKYKSLSSDKMDNDKNRTIKKGIKNPCIKPFHNQKKYPKEDMEYLKKLCSMTQNEYFVSKNKNNDIKNQNDEVEEDNKYLKHANTVLIKGVPYNKKDLPKISKVILKECNYIKNYFGKEQSGEGKTMITRGLSVNEFTKKYGLPK